MLLSLVFCACWGLVLILLQKLYYSDIRFNCCVVCLIHAFASCRGCEMVWYIEQSLKLDQFGSDLTESQYCVLSLSTGYFLYSTIMDVYNNVEFFYVVHHILCILILMTSITTLKCGPKLIVSIWCCEFSGPCFNLRNILQKTKYKSSVIALVNECAFAVVFIICRYGLGGWAFYKLLLSPDSLVIIKFGISVFFLFNQYIFYQMVVKAKPVLQRFFKESHVKPK